VTTLIAGLTFITEQPRRLRRSDTLFELFDFQTDFLCHTITFLFFGLPKKCFPRRNAAADPVLVFKFPMQTSVPTLP